MQNQHPTQNLEYRVIPFTQYQVTRYIEYSGGMASSEPHGEYANEHMALAVAEALCKVEHEALGWPIDDERITCPSLPKESPLDLVRWLAALRGSAIEEMDCPRELLRMATGRARAALGKGVAEPSEDR